MRLDLWYSAMTVTQGETIEAVQGTCRFELIVILILIVILKVRYALKSEKTS